MQIETVSVATRLYEHIKRTSLDFGAMYTYEDLETVAGKPVQQFRSAIASTTRRLERNDSRTLVCEGSRGYRIAHPSESKSIAAVRGKRAQKQIEKGLHTVKHTDRSALTDQERHDLDSLISGMSTMRADLRRANQRIAAAEGRIETLEDEPRLAPHEIALVRDLLKRAT